MGRCRTCGGELRRGSNYCPRCGEVIDDGLDRRGLRRRVVIAILTGLVSIGLLIFLLVARRVSG